MARLALTASNAAVAGTITRRTASSVNGTTTTPTTATTILAFVWLCPRIDVLVNSWTRVSVGSACRNVAIAWNHRPPWRYWELTQTVWTVPDEKCTSVYIFHRRVWGFASNIASVWNQRHPCRYWKTNFAVHKIKQVNITYSERPWMGVVLSRNEFVKTNSQLTNVHGGTFVNDTDI